MTIIDDWAYPKGLPILYIRANPSHLAGVILVPGSYGLKDPAKNYPDYGSWEEFKDGEPQAFLHLLETVKDSSYIFYEQLWCGIFIVPERPYDLNFVCVQLRYESLIETIGVMASSTQAKVYPSPFDLYEIFEELGEIRHPLKAGTYEWQFPRRVNRDREGIEKALEYMVFRHCWDMIPDFFNKRADASKTLATSA